MPEGRLQIGSPPVGGISRSQPLGVEGFWETLKSPEVPRHRAATLLVAGQGVCEMPVKNGRPLSRGGHFIIRLTAYTGSAGSGSGFFAGGDGTLSPWHSAQFCCAVMP